MIQNKQQLSGFHYSEKSNDKNNTDLDIFQCEYPMKLCSLLLSTVSHFWWIGNSSAPQFCANLIGMMTNCAKLHYSFTSTAWIWCKVMLDCAKGRRLDKKAWMSWTSPYWAIALHHKFVQMWVEWWQIVPNCTTVSVPQLESGAKSCWIVPKEEDLM